jgi:hypothetical protein
LAAGTTVQAEWHAVVELKIALDNIAKLLLPLFLCLQTVVEKKIAKEQGVTRHQLGQWANVRNYLA